MSTTLYFRGPVVWMDSCSSVFLYSHTMPFSITTRDLGISSSLLRKRWSVSWFFTAGAGNKWVLTKPEALWVFGYELYLPSLTQDVRSPFELLYQQVSGSFGDLQDLQVTCVEQTIIWLNHVSINLSIHSGQGFLRDLVSSCCEWSFLWQSCSWCYLLHKHHTDPPVCLKQSARHNLHAAVGGRKKADMRVNEEIWVRPWYCDLLLMKLDSKVTSEMFGSSKQSLSPWWVCGLG